MNKRTVGNALCAIAAVAAAATWAKTTTWDPCIFCGDGEAPEPYTPTTTITTTEECVFCGGGTTSYTSTSSSGGKMYSDFSKAQTLQGYYTAADGSSGTATLKIGKISRKGTVKVSATLKSASGKKYTASASVAADASAGTAEGTLPFSSKNAGAMQFELAFSTNEGMAFAGTSANGWEMQSYEVESSGDDPEDDGGTLGSLLGFTADTTELEPPEDYDFVTSGPDGEPVYVGSKGKWTCDKIPSVKYKKFKEDGETWYELTGLDDETKTNVSGLKISFKAKKGTFSGSFRIYASNEASTEKKPKLKKYTVKFSGRIAGSGGSGTGTVKIGKIKYTIPVTIETVE